MIYTKQMVDQKVVLKDSNIVRNDPKIDRFSPIRSRCDYNEDHRDRRSRRDYDYHEDDRDRRSRRDYDKDNRDKRGRRDYDEGDRDRRNRRDYDDYGSRSRTTTIGDVLRDTIEVAAKATVPKAIVGTRGNVSPGAIWTASGVPPKKSANA